MLMMPTIALLTCSRLPDLFETDRTLIPLFEQHGIKAEAAIWNDPLIDWKKYWSFVIPGIIIHKAMHLLTG
jgi:hypothetical protein